MTESSEHFEIIDVTDEVSFALVPPCADAGFDHRSCDYWEDAARGSKAARLDWFEPATPSPARSTDAPSPSGGPSLTAPPANPFLADRAAARQPPANPFLEADESSIADNPFASRRAPRASVGDDAPRKLRLLGRGLGVTGSYAKVLRVGGVAVAYAQFGPLTAYPRAQRTRELYPALPDSPLPAVITCIATTSEARSRGHARALVEAVCDDLAQRGFAAVETYPEVGASPDATSAASPGFWTSVGFRVAAADDRFPVMRRELE